MTWYIRNTIWLLSTLLMLSNATTHGCPICFTPRTTPPQQTISESKEKAHTSTSTIVAPPRASCPTCNPAYTHPDPLPIESHSPSSTES